MRAHPSETDQIAGVKGRAEHTRLAVIAAACVAEHQRELEYAVLRVHKHILLSGGRECYLGGGAGQAAEVHLPLPASSTPSALLTFTP